MTKISFILYLSLVSIVRSFRSISVTKDFQKLLHRNKSYQSSRVNTLRAEKYGRGAEIYPPTNQIEFTLGDSFSNGIVPPVAQQVLDNFSSVGIIESELTKNDHNSTLNTTSIMSGTGSEKSVPGDRHPFYKRILRLAAKSEEQSLSSNSISTYLESNLRQSIFSTTRLPSVLAIAMVILGFVPPTPMLTSIFISGYLYLLSMIAAAPRSSATSSSLLTTLPALPVQGHVPSLVSNPLGTQWSQSATYDTWLRLGVFLGLIAPTVSAINYAYIQNTAAGRVVGSHVFMLCVQTLTERYFRKSRVTPLPIRILVPLLYNSARMGILYHWMKMVVAGHFQTWGKFLGVLNGLYWSMNLFGFLIPIASLRYLRAHFFCVEASEVVVRQGGDHSIGLLS